MNPIKLFKVALTVADLNYRSFGELHGVSKQYVYQVATGRIKSPEMEKEIESFMKKQVKVLRKYLDKEFKSTSLLRQLIYR